MPETPVARRYAKALLELARGQGLQETVGVELARVAEVLADPSLAQLLALPNLPLKTRRDITERLSTALALQPLTSNFLRVLAENGRLDIIPQVENAYQHLLERALGRVRAKVRAAAPLSEEELNALVDAFSRLTNMTVLPTIELDPELLGGVTVEIEGRVYDASLKTQLQRLGETLARQT
ncbi:MAG TPA: ATP synthase F1 subunit delta [Candidatus Binatia bacterium]|nr:ATP synthase F1 subunit delta [Candidatus Binatia bacterium]